MMKKDFTDFAGDLLDRAAELFDIAVSAIVAGAGLALGATAVISLIDKFGG